MFYRGKVRVFETPAVERTTIDAAAGTFAFLRLAFYVGLKRALATGPS